MSDATCWKQFIARLLRMRDSCKLAAVLKYFLASAVWSSHEFVDFAYFLSREKFIFAKRQRT